MRFWDSRLASCSERKPKKNNPETEDIGRSVELINMNYHEYIKSDSWKERRLAYIEIFGGCEVCGKTKNLHVHHKSYDNVGKEHLDDVTVLCSYHHKKIHFSNKGKFYNDWKRNYKRLKSLKKTQKFKNQPPMLECNRCLGKPETYFYSVWANGFKHFCVVCPKCGVHKQKMIRDLPIATLSTGDTKAVRVQYRKQMHE